jgi:hypothetical protein
MAAQKRACGRKADGFSGTGIGDSPLPANCLDKRTRFLPNSGVTKADLKSGGGLSPLGSSPLPDPQIS